ncbi:DHA2 family efflux MFS transporter permease subunit [Dyella dinghuensis]|uniref:DHA2 family efflux MFS transporter permease subunit n=1 Tax=Dyella dinghuensis TaxID=1920169 RepID=A0A432LWK1_9GAMM|nr:MFS transporter [Dyella dinghuensis]RUL65875.1 DHA2 family efflux MFS transporter permease subunit [Dyella dinghuensis]
MSHIGTPPCDKGVVLSDALAKPCAAASRRWTLLAAVLGSSLAFMDGTVVNVTLPAIQHQFNASVSDVQWIMEAYTLVLAALLLVGGALGDHYGRRRLFVIGIALFATASIGCAMSSSALQLIATRAIQGIGAAMLIPGSLALVSSAYPLAERGAAIGTWSAFSGITTAVGPVAGGFLVEHYSWKWAFLLNLPISILLLLICLTKVPESFDKKDRDSVDLLGALLVTLALAGIVFSLIDSQNEGVSTVVLIAGVGGVIAFILFFWMEMHKKNPMLPLGLFRERNFAGANLLTFLLYAAMGGSLFFLPLNLIQVQGYGATAAGAAFMPLVVIMFALSRWAGRLVDLFGSKLPLIVGPLVASVGFGMFAWPSINSDYWSTFFPAICVMGLGMSVTVAPLTTTVMNAVDTDRAGTASGVNNAVSRVAGLLAIAVFGIVLTRQFDSALHSELVRLQVSPATLSSILAQRQKLAGIVVPVDVPHADALALRHAIGMSFVSGFRWVMAISSACALLAAISACFFIDGKGAAAITKQR